MALPALAGIGKGLMGATKGLMGGGAKQGGKAMAAKMLKGGSEEQKDNRNNVGEGPKVSIIKRPAVNFDKFVDKVKIEEVEVDVDDPKVEPLEQALKGLTAIAYSMQDTVDDRLKLEKKKEKYREQRRLRLERLRRGIGAGINLVKGAVGAVNKATGGIFDKIQRYFMMILIGGLVTWVVKNYEMIVKKFEEIRDKLIEWKETYFDPFMEGLDKYLLQPMMRVFDFIVGPLVEMMARWSGVPDYEAEENSIMQNINEILKSIPGIGDAVKAVEDLFSGKSKPGEYKPSEGGPSYQYDSEKAGGLVASGGVDMGTAGRKQVSAAGFGESEFTLFRDTVAEIESGGKYDIQGGSGGMYSGRYQMGAAARQDAARFLGETYQGDSEAARKAFREDPQMQERYFAAYTRANHETLTKLSPEYRGLSREGKLQVLGYAHNAGAGNAVKWLKGGMSESFRDGFGTRSDKYSASIRKAQEMSRSGQLAPPSPDTPPAERSVGSGSGAIVEYLTGDRSSSGYRADHGGSNYHEHLAFASVGERDAAMDLLRSNGITIGSINTGKHAPGSYHYVNQAFDVPLYPNIQNLGIPDTRAGEEKFSKMVRDILAGGGFTGSGVGTSGASITPPAERKTQKQAQSVSQEPTYSGSQQVAYVVTPVVNNKVSSGGGGLQSTSNKEGGSASLNRKQQYDYMKFLYKG